MGTEVFFMHYVLPRLSGWGWCGSNGVRLS